MHKRILLPLAASFVVGCAPPDPSEGDEVGQVASPLAVEGPWQIPEEVLALGDQHDIEYTGAGPWVGEDGCGGNILSGTDILRDYLYAHFPQTFSIGGYSCRPINGDSSQMSVHATGRALDIMLPLDGGEADNGLGDPIGNWLVENAEAIGIQYIIWDLYTWGGHRPAGDKGRPYGGAHPHHDHLHIELALERSEETSNWFEDEVEAPVIEGCNPLPSAGGILEEDDACVVLVGPGEYWRTEAAGHGGSLRWTNAWANDEPSNWARWNLLPSIRGEYEVEVYVEPSFGVHQTARYVVSHAEGEEEVIIDQSAAEGWTSLGRYVFAAGPGQHVSLFDNEDYDPGDDQHIAVDALRLTRLDTVVPPLRPDPGSVDHESPYSPVNALGGPPVEEAEGCSVVAPGSSSPSPWWAMAVAGLALAVARRRS